MDPYGYLCLCRVVTKVWICLRSLTLVLNILTIFCPSQLRSGDEKAKLIGTGFFPSFCLFFLYLAWLIDRCVNVNANHSDNCYKERVAYDGRLSICIKRSSVPIYIERWLNNAHNTAAVITKKNPVVIQHGMTCNWFLNILIGNTSRQVSVESVYEILLNNYNSLTFNRYKYVRLWDGAEGPVAGPVMSILDSKVWLVISVVSAEHPRYNESVFGGKNTNNSNNRSNNKVSFLTMHNWAAPS